MNKLKNSDLVLSPEQQKRFDSNVDSSGGPDACWPWLLSRWKAGYGKITVRGKSRKAHRVAYTKSVGVIPDGLCICHHCDNPPCCNPKHLFAGTEQDNTDDKCRKGRQPTGLKNGAYTKPESRPRGDANGSRTKPQNLRRGDNHPARLHPERMARGDRNGSRTHPECLKRGDENGSRKYPERLVRGKDHWTYKRPGDVINGTSVHTAVLDETKVREIRRKSKTGISNISLGAEYGVHQATIYCIVVRRTWKHVK